MKYLLVGRSGRGKDHLQRELERRGLKSVKSYATRPKRYPTENTHIFINAADVDNYPDKVAYTKIGNYEYFATKQQVKEADVYIIDPAGVDYLLKSMPDTVFHVVYITADSETARERAIARGKNAEKEAMIYDKRYQAEDAEFLEFEDRIGKKEPLADNCNTIYFCENTFKSEFLSDYADCLMMDKRKFDRLTIIAETLIDHDAIPTDNQGQPFIKEDGIEKSISMDILTDILFNHERAFNQALNLYLSLPVKDSDTNL